jgi:hypothetical protein
VLRAITRFTRAIHRPVRAVWIVVAVALAVLLVSVVTIDLGPALRVRAERAGSNWLARPLHIGRLGIRLGVGRFVVEDLRIDGLNPGDEPSLVARRVEVALTWGALFHREVLLDSIEMEDWRMVVESWAGGRHSFPRFSGPPRAPRQGPAPVVTTLQYVHAGRGEFVYRDHATPWSVSTGTLDVIVTKAGEYRGLARFDGGTIRIRDYAPMRADLKATFRMRGPTVLLDQVDLFTTGAESRVTGTVALNKWPEQTYDVRSTIHFPQMREIFWPKDTFALHGDGDFTGTFRLFSGGRELKGRFASAEAGINDYRFQDVTGDVLWVPDRMEVTDATTRFSGGTADFSYAMTPLGAKDQPAHAILDATYRDVDLLQLSEFYEIQGLRLSGTASGHNRLDWPLGAWKDRTGGGTAHLTPPDGRPVLGRTLPADAGLAAQRRAALPGPFSNHLPLEPLPLAGALTYTLDGARIHVDPSEVATTDTFVAFEGDTAWTGDDSRLPFHVTSTSWQDSDRLLAGLMTAFGARTAAVPIDGVGEFDGVMVGSFRSPRIEGRFAGREMRGFDVTWGAVQGDVVIENSYANVTDAVITRGASRMEVEGQFSLGYPRRDGGDEIDARIRIDQRPVPELLLAFDLFDYPVDGMLSGEFHVYGRYTRPFGFGRVTIDRGTAYGETFAKATASLRFEGNGVRLDGVEAQKGSGLITAAAFVGWNGTYSFNADGRRLAVETLDVAAFPGAPPLTGVVDFTAGGSATFESPRYDVKVSVRDLFLGDEGIGEAGARLAIRGDDVTFDLDAASPRLAVSGSGRVALTEAMTGDISFRINDTSLDPYVRVVQPTFPPYTTAVGSGTIRITGDLAVPERVRIATTVEDLQLRLFDYELRNKGPIRVGVDGRLLRIEDLRLTGDRTELDLAGTVDLTTYELALRATGDANLAVLQGLLPDIRSSGRAEVAASVSGTTERPVVSGNALLTDGRLRTFAFPHALEALNGIVTFNASGVRLDGIRARLAGGDVRFGGRVGLSAYELTDLDVTAAGTDMRLRYPEGMRSLVDATLALQGPATAPVLSGTVAVKSASWTPSADASASLFGGGSGGPSVPGAVAQASGIPIVYDVRVVAPSTLRIENDLARLVVAADVNLRGTFDKPLVFGRADIERGEVRFEGRRYLVTRGSLDFTNPERILPFFDVEAETRIRVPGQTYRVTLRVAGTTERLQPEFTSDPPLPAPDVLSLLLGDTRPAGDAEVAALRSPNQREQDLLQARATRALTGALSAEVGKVVEQTFGVDTFQVTPLLVDPYQQSARLNVNPAARITIGKRLSDRVFLTYVRSLSSSTRDEIILLEYDQSESLAWVLSQNEDRTYALEVRKRVSF